MIRCPTCGAENYDSVEVCYRCGHDIWPLPYPLPTSSEPTQPVRVQPASTQPLPYPYPPPPVPPYPPYNTNFPPPVAEPAPPSRLERMWPLLLLSVVMLFLCVFGVVALAISTSTARSARQLSTQVAGSFFTPTPALQATDPEVLKPPTPWPTFTPAPFETPVDQEGGNASPGAEPTPRADLKKLLTPECAAALDDISSVSDNLSKNPTRLLDSTWRENFNQAVDAMRAQCGTFDNASPVPSLLGDTSKNLDLASQEFDQARTLMDTGFKEWSPSKIFEAAGHFGQATRYLNQALSDLKKIGQ